MSCIKIAEEPLFRRHRHEISGARVAKELDLFESNHGCGGQHAVPGRSSETLVT